jgi:excisionase family DNA binding protein
MVETKGDGENLLDKEKMYTTASAARYVGVSEGTIKRWGREGKLQCTTTERGVRIYSEAALEAARLQQEEKRAKEKALTS